MSSVIPINVQLKCYAVRYCYMSNLSEVLRWKVRSGVEMRNMHNLVRYCVPLIGGSVSRPFHDVASPNLVGDPKSNFQ